ncbi:hypothetical protein J6590_057751 [Homalodisca vitripennis]|nr:hypothetical protein J6590_057751 [Homalodisca vitripennis]
MRDKLAESLVPTSIVDLLGCYLTGRTFRICVGGELSTERPIEAGVPQGSAQTQEEIARSTAGKFFETAAASKHPQIAAIAAARRTEARTSTGDAQPPSWTTLSKKTTTGVILRARLGM